MKKVPLHIIVFLLMVFSHQNTIAQDDNESAKISLEKYSDEFQENFFEALKYEAIEDYEKAIAFLLKCKKIAPQETSIDFKLGKNYYYLQQFQEAESYLQIVLEKEPQNKWYVDALLTVYTDQNKYKKTIVLLDELDAKLEPSEYRNEKRSELQNKINSKNVDKNQRIVVKNPLEAISQHISRLQEAGNYTKLLDVATTALENYPSQANFYYAKGIALSKLNKYKESISELELALSFLIDDVALENNIYKELVLVYEAMRNYKKAQEYQKRVKNGL